LFENGNPIIFPAVFIRIKSRARLPLFHDTIWI
jgi:hypothetical protein